MKNETKNTAFVTGSAGFIGFHMSKKLLELGWRVVGLDCLSDYYDVTLKESREKVLLKQKHYKSVHKKLESPNILFSIMEEEKPNLVIHLAAQAGVRHSIDRPRNYINTNIIGTFELLEAVRAFPPDHVLMASTSSAYGANTEMPYQEKDKADYQVSLYAATKKSCEVLAHSYSHLYSIPITMLRFFTVYGPWGRPDMAAFKFTSNILKGKAIDVYNFGKMKRDFTYIDDIINSIKALINLIPNIKTEANVRRDSLSPVAPYRIVNIGNSSPTTLTHFIEAIENATGISAVKNFKSLQKGDVTDTWADTQLLNELTGYTPNTDLQVGINRFVEWYRYFYKI